MTDGPSPLRVLLVEDSADDAELVLRALRNGGLDVESRVVATEAELRSALTPRPDVVVADWSLPGFSGAAALAIAHESAPTVPCILISGWLGEDLVVAALQNGAVAYVPKNRLEALVPAVHQALAGAEARRERDRLAAVVAQSFDGIAITDSEMRISYVNAALEGKLGRGSSELVGRGVMEVAAGVLGATGIASFVEVVRSGQPWLGEADWRRLDGTVGRVQIKVTPRVAEDGTVEGQVITFRDVTELRRSEVERLRLASAVEQAAESISIADLDTRIIYVNHGFERVTGYASSEVIGQNLLLLRSALEPPSFYDAIRAALTSGSSWTGDIVNRRKDGSFWTAESVVSPVRDSSGVITSYVAVQRDVTTERELLERSGALFQERALLLETIRGLRAGETPEATAQAICRQVASLTGIIATQLLLFEPNGYAVPLGFVVVGQADPPLERLSYNRSRQLFGRASEGPWIEPRTNRGRHPNDQPVKGVGIHSLAHAPVSYDGQVIGLLTVQATDAVEQPAIFEVLPAIVEFADLAGAIIGHDVVERTETGRSRGHISHIIAHRSFRPVFQPIVDLRRHAIVGYEALTRFSDGSDPESVFAEAAEVGLGTELETATLRASLAAAKALPRSAWLTLNASPELILAADPLLWNLHRSRRRLILEVSEHTAITDYPAFRAALDALGPKVELAVDDAGAGFASLRHILELRPAFVKLDRWLVAEIGGDEARQAMIIGLAHFARSTGCRLIAEGIETDHELAVLWSLGIRLGQGYLLGHPLPIDEFDSPSAGPGVHGSPVDRPPGVVT